MIVIAGIVEKALKEVPDDYFIYCDADENGVSIKCKSEAMSSIVAGKLVQALDPENDKFRKEMASHGDQPEWSYQGYANGMPISIRPCFPNPECKPVQKESAPTTYKSWVCEIPTT